MKGSHKLAQVPGRLNFQWLKGKNPLGLLQRGVQNVCGSRFEKQRSVKEGPVYCGISICKTQSLPIPFPQFCNDITVIIIAIFKPGMFVYCLTINRKLSDIYHHLITDVSSLNEFAHLGPDLVYLLY